MQHNINIPGSNSIVEKLEIKNKAYTYFQYNSNYTGKINILIISPYIAKESHFCENLDPIPVDNKFDSAR